MAIDTSISKTSAADPKNLPSFRKQSSNAIDVNRLSFFDELLGIGQFSSQIPDASTLPSPSSPENNGTTEPASDERNADNASELAPFDSSSPSPLAPLPQAISPTEKQRAEQPVIEVPRGKSDSNPQRIVAASESGGTASSQGTASAIETDREGAPGDDSSAVLHESVLNEVELDSELSSQKEGAFDIDIEELHPAVGKDENAHDSQRVQPTRESSGSDKHAEDRPTEEALVSPARADESKVDLQNGSRIRQGGEPSEQDSSNTKPATEVTQPRNKRAAYLAERASEETDRAQPTEPSTFDASKADSTLSTSEPNEAKNLDSTVSLVSTSTASSPIPPLTGALSIAGQPLNGVSSPLAAASSSRGPVESIGAGGAAAGSALGTSTSIPSYGSGSPTSPGRADQPRSEATRGSSSTAISPYQEGKLVQRVLRGLEQLSDGGGQVRLRLHPPELGSLQMSLRIEAGQVFAKLEVESTVARDALLNNVQTLRDRLAEQGMRVGSFEVEVSTDSSGLGTGGNPRRDGSSGSESRWENATSRFAMQNSNRLQSESANADSPSPSWVRTHGSFDQRV